MVKRNHHIIAMIPTFIYTDADDTINSARNSYK